MTERSRNITGLGLALAVIAAAAHARGLQAPFFFDDLDSIALNRNLRSLAGSLSWPEQSTIAGRPLVALSLGVNHALGGLSVTGYHVFNLACHVLTTLLLFGLLRRTLQQPALAERFGAAATGLGFSAALLWATHPLQTEAVTYVIQRTELMMGLFYVGTLYCAVRGWASERRAAWHGASAACCILGVLCKEVMISAPLMVWLYDRTFVSGSFRTALVRSRRLYTAFFVAWVVLAALMLGQPRDRSVGFGLGVSSWEYLLTQAEVLVHYIKLSLWPAPLVVSYDWPIVETLGQVWWQGLVLVGLVLATCVGLLRRAPVALLGCWFFLLLAPSSSVVPIVTEVAAERRMYLPLLALVLPAVLAAWVLLRRVAPTVRRPAALAAVALMAAACVSGSVRRLGDYDSVLSIWQDAAAKDPGNYMAVYQLAWAIQEDGRPEEAMPYFLHAYNLQPSYVPTLTTMGVCLMELNQFDEAIRRFKEALRYEPFEAALHHNLGLCAAHQGRLQDAVAHMQDALRYEWEYPDAHSNLAVLLTNTDGSTDEVVEHLGEALRMEPGHPKALGLLQKLQGGGG